MRKLILIVLVGLTCFQSGMLYGMMGVDENKKLISAVLNGNLSKAEKAINAGANVNASDTTGMTPLNYAVGYGERWTSTFMLQNEGGTALLELLIKAGADINGKSSQGNTLLHLISQRSASTDKNINDAQVQTIITLIELGADQNIKNKVGKTPLQLAQENNRLDIIKALVTTVSPVEIQYKKGVVVEELKLPFAKKNLPAASEEELKQAIKSSINRVLNKLIKTKA